MFGLNMSGCAVNGINSHAEAVGFYERCPIKGGHEYGDERRIKGKESSRQLSVRIRNTGEVAFRYHNTDVVTWHPDNSYAVETFPSRSTCEFASRFMPNQHLLAGEGARLHIGPWDTGRVYPVTRPAPVRGDTVKTNAVFERQVVDRKGAKMILNATRYAEYRDWYNVMFPMVRDSMPYSWKRKWLSPMELMEMLDDPAQWHDIMMGIGGTPAHVREVFYRDRSHLAYKTERAKYLPASKANNKWRVTLD